MSKLNIREAVHTDLPSIMELIEQPDMSPDNQLNDQDSRKLFEEITSTGCHKIFVAFSDSELVGTFALVYVQSLTHNGGSSAVVEDVVVKHSAQGQGLGRAMMQYAAEAAKRLGAQKLVLSSGNARIKAHEFYEHLGYQRDGFRFALDI